METAVALNTPVAVGGRCSSKKKWYSRQSYKKTGSEDTGTVDAWTAFTLTDAGKGWSTNFWAPGVLRIMSGPGSGQVRRITGNTGDTLMIAHSWLVFPSGSSTYRVMNASTWTEINDVSDDNKNADGETNITWDLE